MAFPILQHSQVLCRSYLAKDKNLFYEILSIAIEDRLSVVKHGGGSLNRFLHH